MTAFPLGSWRAPAEETSSGDIEAATKAFYETLLLGGSIADCRDAARLREPTFRIYSAEEAFLAGWRQAIGQLPTSNREIQEKAEEIVTLIKAPDPDRPDSGLHRRAKQAIRALDLSAPFENYKRAFFMIDLFPQLSEELKGSAVPVDA
jgi:hypothetical protein